MSFPPTFKLMLSAFVLVLGLARSASAAHLHLNAGAVAQAPAAKLFFANGQNFNTASRYLVHLRAFTNAAYGPIFRGGEDISLSSLPATGDLGGPDPFAAQLGACLAVQFVAVSGPAGGSLSLWDTDGFFIPTTITLTVPVGTANGTNHFLLSENDGSPGSDPYGHIHDRKFSADRAGLYTVAFRVIDISTNGPGGGPLHPPSDPHLMYFQAGTTLSYSPVGGTARFGTESGKSYYVQASPELGVAADWRDVAGPVTGTAKLETVTGLTSDPGNRFFRLRVPQP
jgi:hypothetical protein